MAAFMKKPALTPDIIGNDFQLHRVIDELLTSEQTYWRFSRRILRLQLRHQELASEDAFVALLDIEEAVNERHAWELALVARFFWRRSRE